MSHTPILATGLNGLIGSKLAETFQDHYDFGNLDISHPTQPIDITDEAQVRSAIEASPAKVIVHLAAFTDVTRAWEERDNKDGLAYRVNVLGTQNIINAAAASGKHLIHISTAYVFDGTKAEMYTETDTPAPIEWYGQTKAWAEEAVQAANIPWTILRIDQPFRSDPFAKLDVAHKVIKGLRDGALYPQFTNHFVGPTFIDDFVKVIEWVIRTQQTGLFHATAGEQWTDYDFAVAIQNAINLPGEVKQGDLQAYLQNAVRPYQVNTALDSSKLNSMLDFKPRSIQEAVTFLKE